MKPEFKIVNSGYDPQSVDSYINHLNNEYEQAVKDNAAYSSKLRELEAASPQREDIYQALLAAQGAARKIEAEAQEKADRLLSAAAAESENLLNEAKASITRAFEETRVKTEEIIAEAKVRAEKITARANEHADLSKEARNNIKKELTELYEALAVLMKGGGIDGKYDEFDERTG